MDFQLLHPNFLDLEEEYSQLETSKVVVVSLPYEATTTYGTGTRFGPEAIIKASAHLETYDEELNLVPAQIGIATIQPDNIFSLAPEKFVQKVADLTVYLLEQGKFVIGLGGEHTISVGLVEGFKRFYSDFWVLQLDAHSDLRYSYKSSRYNHACVMARIQEKCAFVGVGIRSGILHEAKRLKEPSRIFYAHEMYENSNWPQEVLKILGEKVYITIDLDFFDPAIMPSVGTPEPGGFGWYDSLKFLKQVIRTKKVLGFDVVELSPVSDLKAPDFMAAKLIYKLIGYIFEEELSKRPKRNLD